MVSGRFLSPIPACAAVRWMLTLNDRASEAATQADATAATDVTGFGLLGQAYTMVKNSQVDFLISHSAVPVLAHVLELVLSGIVPEGAHKNLQFLEGKVDFGEGFPQDDKLVLTDPQTSGGILIATPESNVGRFALAGVYHSIIGKVTWGTGRLRVQ